MSRIKVGCALARLVVVVVVAVVVEVTGQILWKGLDSTWLDAFLAPSVMEWWSAPDTTRHDTRR